MKRESSSMANQEFGKLSDARDQFCKKKKRKRRKKKSIKMKKEF